jgi:hypothetical protein
MSRAPGSLGGGGSGIGLGGGAVVTATCSTLRHVPTYTWSPPSPRFVGGWSRGAAKVGCRVKQQ